MENQDEHLLDTLEHSYLDFAHAMLAFLRERIAIKTIRDEKRIEFGPGYYKVEDKTQPDLWQLLAPRLDEDSPWTSPLIRQSIQAHWDAMLAKMVQSDGFGPATGALFEQYEHVIRKVFAEPLLQALQTIAPTANLSERDVTSCTDEVIMAQYRRIRALWLSAILEWQATAPLQHFDASALDVLPVQLAPSFSLTHWTSADKTQIWNHTTFRIGESLYPEGLSIDHFRQADYCLKAKTTVRRDRRGDMQTVGAEALAILTALRLIKPGPVQLAYTFLEAPAGATTHQYHTLRNPLDVRGDQPATKYRLLPSDLPLLQRLIAGVRRARRTPQPAGLWLALNRFDQSYSRESGEDMVIDLTIALESTLLAGLGADGEYKYKFALYGAALLAGSRHPPETYELLSRLYVIRSQIVHLGQLLPQLQKYWSKIPGISSPAHFIEAAHVVARDILREYTLQLGKGRQPQTVREQIERGVLEALEWRGQKQQEELTQGCKQFPNLYNYCILFLSFLLFNV